MPKKPASALADNPKAPSPDYNPRLPVNTALDNLTQLSGDRLEISTRSNVTLNRAAASAFIYTSTFGSAYAKGRIEQIERLAVSSAGEGRKDIIETIRAGGTVPDAYLNGGVSSEYSGLRDEE